MTRALPGQRQEWHTHRAASSLQVEFSGAFSALTCKQKELAEIRHSIALSPRLASQRG